MANGSILGPAIAFLSFDISEADEARSGIRRVEAKDMLGDDRKVPCINVLIYEQFLSTQPFWKTLEYDDKQVVMMELFQHELSVYGADETVCVCGFFVIFSEYMIRWFLDQYTSKVYLVYNSGSR